MASQGPLSPGTLADDASIGSTAWTNPGNAAAADAVYAAVIPSPISHYLKATNFGFAIPAGATITGVLVEIKCWTPTAGAYYQTIKLVKGGTVSGNNKSLFTVLPPANAYVSFGSSSDLWGLALTVSDINASNFGVVLEVSNGGKGSGTANVDHMRITVTYTGGAVANNPPPPFPGIPAALLAM